MKAYSLTKRLNQWLRRQFKKLLVVTGSTEKQPDEFGEAMKQFLARVSVLFDSVEE